MLLLFQVVAVPLIVIYKGGTKPMNYITVIIAIINCLINIIGLVLKIIENKKNKNRS